MSFKGIQGLVCGFQRIFGVIRRAQRRLWPFRKVSQEILKVTRWIQSYFKGADMTYEFQRCLRRFSGIYMAFIRVPGVLQRIFGGSMRTFYCALRDFSGFKVDLRAYKNSFYGLQTLKFSKPPKTTMNLLKPSELIENQDMPYIFSKMSNAHRCFFNQLNVPMYRWIHY